MIRPAREKGRLEVAIVGLRDLPDDSHRPNDDYPFGGGVGMVMKVEPIDRALASLAVGEPGARPSGTRVVLLSPQGPTLDQARVIAYAGLDHLVLVCGRYKGVDERVRDHLVDEELSIGDCVLSGGEPAALCVVDAVARLLPGVLGDFDSAESDSFHSGLLDCAYYTRPAEFAGERVPDVLLSGDHARIARWRRENALRRTFERRPDLLEGAALDAADLKFIRTLTGEPEPSAPPRRAKTPRARGAGEAPKERS